MENRPEPIEASNPDMEEKGCCEDLKAAFAHVDGFVIKKYFEATKQTIDNDFKEEHQELKEINGELTKPVMKEGNEEEKKN